MKTFILLLFVTVASAGLLPEAKYHFPLTPVLPVMTEKELEGRITNGEIASPGQFPYQVGLSLKLGKGSAWCGGSIIDSRWILTAAHCADQVDGVTVYLGAFDIKNDREKGQQRIYASKANIYVHPGYDPAIIKNDIALIKLPVEIEFNNLIQPAALPKKNGKQYSTYEGELVWASGWGRDSDSATGVTQFLRYIEVPVMKTSSCRTYYMGNIDDSQVCISTKKGKKSTCNGDSGGPLVHKENGENTVIGATSFGISFGCEKGWPGVFTRVSFFLDWIEQVTGGINKSK